MPRDIRIRRTQGEESLETLRLKAKMNIWFCSVVENLQGTFWTMKKYAKKEFEQT